MKYTAAKEHKEQVVNHERHEIHEGAINTLGTQRWGEVSNSIRE